MPRRHRSRTLLLALAAVIGSAACTDAASAPTPIAATTTPLPPRRLTLAAAGDIIPYPSIMNRAAALGAATGVAYDFAPIFRQLVPMLEAADVAVCHLEVPIAPPGTAPSGYPDFAAPAEVTVGLARAGFDRCSTASNHSYDRGRKGVAATLDALDAAGVGHAGTAREPGEAEPKVVLVGDVRLAHLAYTWGVNGTVPDDPWRIAFLDPARIAADATAARAAGAEVVVVSLHWGQEYRHEPTGEQRAVAEAVAASGQVDLIVGHHAHVLQPIERVGDTWVAFGLGNLLANQGSKRPATYDGGILQVTFVEGSDGRFRAERPAVVPTWVDARTFTIRPVIEALADPSLDAVHPALEASLARTSAVLGGYVAW